MNASQGREGRSLGPHSSSDRSGDLGASGLWPGLAAALLFAAALAGRVHLVDPAFEARPTRPDEIGTPSAGPDALRILTAEHALAASDGFWLGIVQEFGKAIEGRTVDDQAVSVWANAATDLDPLYLTVYYSVAINFTVYSQRVDDSDALLRKGWAALPQAWQLPFMLGYNAYFLKADVHAAAELWEQASVLPERPRFLLSLAARARYQTGDMLGAEQILEDMIPFLSGPARTDAELRLKAFRSEPILSAYDIACEKYREANGAVPEDAQVLRDQGLVDVDPFDLYGKKIELDEDCRARTEFIRVREDEALKNVGNFSKTAPNYLDIVRDREMSNARESN